MTENFTAMNERLLKRLRKENPGVNINLKKNQFHIFGDISRSRLVLPKGFFKGPQVEVDGNPEFTIRTCIDETRSGHKIYKSYVLIFNR